MRGQSDASPDPEGRKLYNSPRSSKSFGMLDRCRLLFLPVLFSVFGWGFLHAEKVFADRDEIPDKFKWSLDLFYEDFASWEADLNTAKSVQSELMSLRGRLGQSPEVLLHAMELSDQIGLLLTRTFGYVSMLRDIDMRDNEVQERYGQMMAFYAKLSADLSWFNPEILTIPEEQMRSWLAETPSLSPYRFGLLDAYRTGEYTLDANGERLLGLHGRVRRAPGEIYNALTNADGERPEVELSNGDSVTVTPGLYGKALNQYPDGEDRKRVQAAWMKQFEERRNTFASIYAGVLGQGWVEAESRGYESTLQMELNANAIPVEVVENLIQAAKNGSSQLQRYHDLRKRFMGLETYGWSDMHIPLMADQTYYDYEDMVPIVIRSVEPLGPEYVAKMAEQFAEGYVDVFETPGKRSGAYNASRYGVGSFVLLNYHGTLEDVFTVAHEMGHSMHSRLSQEFQPYATHRYTIFVAEVASTLNEKLLLAELLKEVDSPRQRIAFLEHQIGGIVGTFFLQTMMADFEVRAHRLVEAGEGITAEVLTALWEETVKDYHGEVIPKDDPYMYSWARIPHLYNSPYYVYQYATCYASSAYLMRKMASDPSVVDAYMELLKAGGNDHPMEQLKAAGVDLRDPSVFEAVIKEFERLLDVLEKEYESYVDSAAEAA